MVVIVCMGPAILEGIGTGPGLGMVSNGEGFGRITVASLRSEETKPLYAVT